MAKGLIITEKPSVARDITNAIGGFTEHDNGEYYESDDYICTYAVGHLLGLVEPEDLDPSYKRWSLNNLPIIPEEFKLKPKPGQNKRLSCIKKLANRKDVTFYINACDAAREGELIFREIDDFVSNGKPSKRLWLQSMTKDAIIGGFRDLRDSSEVLGLGEAAECRSQADWLIGMNATRALSVRLRTRAQKGAWSAGRVQTPTLALLVNRELEILDFMPDPYWRITAKFKVNGNEYEGYYYDNNFKKDEEHPEYKSDRLFKKEDAEKVLKEIDGKAGVASEIRKPRESKAPILFNLTALQKNMSSRYGWSAKRTLQAAQRCYEQHKVLTYPRTSSSNLPEDYREEVDKILGVYSKTNSYGKHAQYLIDNGRLNDKKVFNNKGVTDHFAIIPTGQMSSTLSGDDQKLYDAVVRRFLSVFYPPAVYDKVDRTTVVDGHHFRTGPVETLAVPGWLGIYEKIVEEKNKQSGLPELVKGETKAENVPVDLNEQNLHDEFTKPPARIGEARLLSLMEHAGRHVEDEELATALSSAEGLGTAATRADIIENLKNKEYVDQNLRATPKGIRLIETLKRMDANRITSAELTAQLEIQLNEVEDRTRTKEKFIDEVASYVADIIEKVKDFDYDEMYPDKNF